VTADPPNDEPDVSGDPEESSGAPAERIADDAPKHTALWVVLSRWLLGTEAWLRSHGGRRLRIGLRVFWGLVAIAGVVLLVGPVINPPLTLDDITNSASTVTDRWIAREFAVDYRISRAADGTLAAHVEERISASFPDGTDERGIQRVLGTQYQGHALDPSNVTATLDGQAVDVGRSETADQLTLTIDGGGTLQGDHSFVLDYDLANLAYLTTDTASGTPVDLLAWDVFGPSWPQGLAGLDVSVTLPNDLDDQLIRQPRGSVAWTLLSAGQWLSPEPGGASNEVTYGFTNDQNMPPHAQAGFTMAFQPGTFTMPSPTPLYWVQVFGPLAPLGFLVLTLLLALAARAVAWSDARGRPWFVAQSDPPADLSPRMAAQILRAPEAMELADALDVAQNGGRGRGKKRDDHRARLIAAARVARRTGRIGDRPRALSRYLSAVERRTQLSSGLRRIPRGFVRDLFIAAPLALTVVQWGIVRQLSYQNVLAVVWWPVVFVIVSSIISAVVLWIALSSRPLTRRGALAKQYLLGIGVYAGRTGLLDRAATTDRVLPYAVLLAAPRTAGHDVAGLIEGEIGDADASEGWRTPSFLTWPRILIRVFTVLLVAGAIAAVALIPGPYPQSVDYLSYSGDLDGTLWTKVQSVDASAELSRTADSHARLGVTERLGVSFSDEGSDVPQFAQQWPNRLDGQDLGLQVQSVTIDGGAVPFVTQQDHDTLLLKTTLADVLTGSHDVQIDYALDSAAVAAPAASVQGGGVVDRVRWAALLDGWEYDSQWGDDPAPDPLRIEFRLSDELAALAASSGWITLDTDAGDEPRDWTPSVVPFGSVAAADANDTGGTTGTADAAATTESSSTAGAAQSHVLDLKQEQSGGWPFELTVDDLGAAADFPAGTFAGPDTGALQRSQFFAFLPLLAVLVLAALAFGLGIAGTVLGLARQSVALAPGAFRDLVRWLAPGAAIAAIILFVWASSDMPDDHPAFLPLILSTLAAVLGAAAGLAFTRSKRASKRRVRRAAA
jgi:hypothetical protein